MSYKWFALVATLVCRCSVCIGEEEDVNATTVPLGMLTHVVYLSSEAGFCSGSIISEEFVLTAAHCLVSIISSSFFGRYQTYKTDPVPHTGVKVSAGVVDMMPSDLVHRQERESTEVIIHPHFRPMKLAGYDVGLVRVSPHFNFTDVVFRVEISEKGMLLGWRESENKSTPCQASGFGDMSNTQAARLKMWDVQAHHGEGFCPCAKRFQWKRLICTSTEGKTSICNGDGGAGLICEDKVVGVSHMVRNRKTCANLGYPECRKKTLNTYTLLCPLNDWIKKYVPTVPPTPKSCFCPRARPLEKYLLMSVTFVCLFYVCLLNPI